MHTIRLLLRGSFSFILPLIALLLVAQEGFSQDRFYTPITISDKRGASKTLYFGVHPNATYCFDPGTLYFSSTDSLTEELLAPAPPSGVFDARFLDIPGRFPCVDVGLAVDIRKYVSVSQIDTFMLMFQDSSTRFPIIMKYPPGLKQKYSSVSVVDALTNGLLFAASMTSSDSIVFKSTFLQPYLIITNNPAVPPFQFHIPITFTDNMGQSAKLDFGLHPDATYCIDAGTFYFAGCDSLKEEPLPVAPPSGVFDIRFIDIPGRPLCIDVGLNVDIRRSFALSQSDTFHVSLNDSAARYPVRLKYPHGLSQYYDSIVVVDYITGGALFRADITIADSLVFTDPNVSSAGYLIIAKRPKSAPPSPFTPTLESPSDNAIDEDSTVALRWEAPPGATYYIVELARDPGFTRIVRRDSLTERFIRPYGLEPDSTFFWHVSGNNTFFTGCYSSTFSFRTRHYTVATGVVRNADNGWNLVSLPLSVSSPDIASLLPGANTQAYSFDPGAGAYQVRDTLTHGIGYWLKFPYAQSLDLRGDPIHHDTINLVSGWNLIGSIYDSVPTAGVVTNPAGILGSPFFGYHGGYAVQSVIGPGFGYWIKANSAGSLILSPGTMTGSLPRPMVAEGSGWDRLRIIDAEGTVQVLSLTKSLTEGKPLSYYELPPVPPEGCFDARFTSGRSVELIPAAGSGFLGIGFHSAKYPLTFSWNLLPSERTISLKTRTRTIPMENSGQVRLGREEEPIGVSVEGVPAVPREFVLEQNYPNPFNPSTTFRYGLPLDAHVRLRIYNLLGQAVASIVDMDQSAGYHEVIWSAGVATGLYFYRLEATGIDTPEWTFTEVRKLVVMR